MMHIQRIFHAKFNLLSTCMGHNNETKFTGFSYRAEESHSTHSQSSLVGTYR